MTSIESRLGAEEIRAAQAAQSAADRKNNELQAELQWAKAESEALAAEARVTELEAEKESLSALPAKAVDAKRKAAAEKPWKLQKNWSNIMECPAAFDCISNLGDTYETLRTGDDARQTLETHYTTLFSKETRDLTLEAGIEKLCDGYGAFDGVPVLYSKAGRRRSCS